MGIQINVIIFQSFFLTLLLSVTSLVYTAFRGDAITTDLDISGLVKVLTSDEEAAKNVLVTLGYVSFDNICKHGDDLVYYYRQGLLH